MLDNSKNKQKKVKFLDYLPNMNVGNTGDIVLSKDVLGFFTSGVFLIGTIFLVLAFICNVKSKNLPSRMT